MLSVSAVVNVLLTIEIVDKRRKKKRVLQPALHRCALIHPMSLINVTPWSQLLSCGTSSNFIKVLNFDRNTFFNLLLPRFDIKRKETNFGSPYRKGNSKRGRKSFLRTIDLLGLILWKLKSSERDFNMCQFFGYVPTSISVWLDYSLLVLKKTVTDKEFKEAEIKWPDAEEMKESASMLEKIELVEGH